MEEMMKKIVVVLLVGVLFGVNAHGQSYRTNFAAAMQAKDYTKAEEILKKWDYDNANDAELYVAYYKLFTTLSVEKDSVRLDQANLKKAMDFISEGIGRFPIRYDMWMLKLLLCERTKDYGTYTKEALKMIDQSKRINNQWKTENFLSLENAENVFNETVQHFQEVLYSVGDTSLFANVLQIADAMIRNYPNDFQAYMNKGTVYAMQKKFDASIENLKKAAERSTDNTILLYNIALVYEMKGDKTKATEYFEKTMENCAKDNKYDKLKTVLKAHIEDLKKK